MSGASSSSWLVSRTQAENPDCWFGIDDPKKRKQIQDRLAQRARRKRLAEAKTSSEEDTTVVRRKRKQEHSPAQSTPASICGFSSSNNSESIGFLPIPINVFTALYRNGQLLGLSCAIVVPSLSKQYGSEIPTSLQPTGLQLITVHPPWIDRFPFPQFRDNFISLSELIDPEDFLFDIFNAPSFTLKVGADSWDQNAWTIEESFKKKWGFLFDPELF